MGCSIIAIELVPPLLRRLPESSFPAAGLRRPPMSGSVSDADELDEHVRRSSETRLAISAARREARRDGPAGGDGGALGGISVHYLVMSW